MDSFQFLQIFASNSSKKVEKKMKPIKVQATVEIQEQEIQMQDNKLHKPSFYGYFMPYTEIAHSQVNQKQVMSKDLPELNQKEVAQVDDNFNFHIMQNQYVSVQNIERKINFIEQQKKTLSRPNELYGYYMPFEHLQTEFFSKKFLNLGNPYKI